MTDRFLGLIGIGIFIAYATFFAVAHAADPITASATACKDGEIWDEGQKKCVPIPRGSHDGSIVGN
ncbi:MAG: hypothetical protein KAI80_09665 [Hyphomicrobiaceae bacterium]|nr:hypothetical protein [Hyphomicrobiaceae bacterium]